MSSPLIDYFGRIEIIHLRERTDRYNALKRELARIGIDVHDERVRIPDAPRVMDDYEFPSRQVYGNFLSHLDILRQACNEQQKAVLVLEDDAIFRHSLDDLTFQRQLVQTLDTNAWGICYLGHPITRQLTNQPTGLIQTNLTFRWAHCYAVHQCVLADLVEYLESTMEHPKGHPEGGKMYIDGALSMFRMRSPHVVTLVSNPTLSIQRGSISGIAQRKWYEKVETLRPILGTARAIRDEIWRHTGFFGQIDG
jgi:GR25 family glycosyltransferase involved in LPS biosynthesis